MSDRRIEREFGVPVAGEILPPEQWTHTALKKLPPLTPTPLPAGERGASKTPLPAGERGASKTPLPAGERGRGEGSLDWPALFGRSAPVVIDIGCGNGRFLIGSAVWRPDHDHLGVDVLPVVIRYATRRANQRGLPNIRFAVCDGRQFLGRFVKPGSVAEIHCYHPQPY